MNEIIKTIIIDDERPALIKMENLLSTYPEFEICGSYTNAQDALDNIRDLQPKVAFLDIAMPDISGMDLAAALHEKCGHQILIIFVTAYDEYALSAFDVRAIDYLLKPVTRARFKETVIRLKEILNQNKSNRIEISKDQTSMIRLFGKVEISRNPPFTMSWRTATVRKLFAFFMHNQNHKIYRDILLETFWPKIQPEKALASLNTCNYYLRKHLEASGLEITLEYDAGYYNINRNGVECDVDLFTIAEEESRNITDENLPLILEYTELYRGAYLEDVKGTWTNLDRERYSGMYVNIRLETARYFYKKENYTETVNAISRALEINMLHTGLWKLLLDSYKKIGDPVRLQRAKDNMRNLYLEKTGEEPPKDLA